MVRAAHLGASQLFAHLAHFIFGAETHHEIDEIVAAEADRLIAIRGRQRQRTIRGREFAQGAR
jgi:hypothetical protein